MTEPEKKIIDALLKCKFSFGRTKDKNRLRRIKTADEQIDADLRALILRLAYRFRKQIPDYETLTANIEAL